MATKSQLEKINMELLATLKVTLKYLDKGTMTITEKVDLKIMIEDAISNTNKKGV